MQMKSTVQSLLLTCQSPNAYNNNLPGLPKGLMQRLNEVGMYLQTHPPQRASTIALTDI